MANQNDNSGRRRGRFVRNSSSRESMSRARFLRTTGMAAAGLGAAAVGLGGTAHAVSPEVNYLDGGIVEISPSGMPGMTEEHPLYGLNPFVNLIAFLSGDNKTTRDGYNLQSVLLDPTVSKIRLLSHPTKQWEFGIKVHPYGLGIERSVEIEGVPLEGEQYVDMRNLKLAVFNFPSFKDETAYIPVPFPPYNIPIPGFRNSKFEYFDISVKNLSFEGAKIAAVGIYGSANVVVDNCEFNQPSVDPESNQLVGIVLHIGDPNLPDGNTEIKNVKININPAPGINLIQGIVRAPSQFALAGTILYAANCNGHLEVSDSEVSVPGNPGCYAINTFGPANDRLHSSTTLSQNNLLGRTCINVFATNESVVAHRNDITVNDNLPYPAPPPIPPSAGILVTNANEGIYKGNHLVGNGMFGIGFAGFSSGNIAQGNTINMTAFSTYFLDSATEGNVLRGNIRGASLLYNLAPEGTNLVTGITPMKRTAQNDALLGNLPIGSDIESE